MQGNYSIIIEYFAESHYIKSFQKKYNGAWDVTRRAVIAEFERIDMLLQTEKAEIISTVGVVKILKTEFKIAGTKESAKTSGNRCIIAVDEKAKKVSVLLIYTKTDVKGTNETVWWKKLVSDTYADYKWVLN
jgi:hypothetical protein